MYVVHIISIIFFFVLAACGAGNRQVASSHGGDVAKHDAMRAWDRNALIIFKVSLDAPAGTVDAASSAAAKWNAAAGREILLVSGAEAVPERGDVGIYDTVENDDVNVIYGVSDWGKMGKSPTVIATAIWAEDERTRGKIITADILLNLENFELIDLTTDIPSGGGRTVVDLETVLIHEMGHALGLDHTSTDPDSVMATTLSLGRIHRNLSQGDREEVRTRYGETGR